MAVFPGTFLWGAATSAHQVEGGNRNDWSEWEREIAKRKAQGAKQTRWPEYLLNNYPSPLQEENYISGRACEHYTRFEDDFDIAKSLGHNAHRFSIEWSRIEPEEGTFDQNEIEHYRTVIRALRARGLEPFVTLWHWTLPLWMRDKGGAESSDFPLYFSRYVERMVREFKDEVTYWMTLNEPTSVIVNSYVRGIWPPMKKSLIAALSVYQTLAQAHRAAYAAIHALHPGALVGFGNILVFYEPYRRWNPADWLSVFIADFFSNRLFLMLTGTANDYYGIQYYFHNRLSFPARVRNENKKTSDMGWELYPEGLYHLVKRMARRGKPIFITENGLADAQDQNRAWFIQETLRWVRKAISDGADIRGYFYWSLLDNFEWDKGFWPRFGLVDVDYKTMERRIRKSAFEYKKIIESSSSSSL